MSKHFIELSPTRVDAVSSYVILIYSYLQEKRIMELKQFIEVIREAEGQ